MEMQTSFIYTKSYKPIRIQSQWGTGSSIQQKQAVTKRNNTFPVFSVPAVTLYQYQELELISSFSIIKKEANLNFANSFIYPNTFNKKEIGFNSITPIINFIAILPFYTSGVFCGSFSYSKAKLAGSRYGYPFSTKINVGKPFSRVVDILRVFVSVSIGTSIAVTFSEFFCAAETSIFKNSGTVQFGIRTGKLKLDSQFRYAFYCSLISKNRTEVFAHIPELAQLTSIEQLSKLNATQNDKTSKVIAKYKSKLSRNSKTQFKLWRSSINYYWKRRRNFSNKQYSFNSDTIRRNGFVGATFQNKRFILGRKLKLKRQALRLTPQSRIRGFKGYKKEKTVAKNKTKNLSRVIVGFLGKRLQRSKSTFKLSFLMDLPISKVSRQAFVKKSSRANINPAVSVRKYFNTSVQKSKRRYTRNIRLYTHLSTFSAVGNFADSNTINSLVHTQGTHIQKKAQSRYVQRKKPLNHYQRAVPFSTSGTSPESKDASEAVGSRFRIQTKDRELFLSNLTGSTFSLYRINALTHTRIAFDYTKKQKDKEAIRRAKRSITQTDNSFAKTTVFDQSRQGYKGRTATQNSLIILKRVRKKDAYTLAFSTYATSVTSKRINQVKQSRTLHSSSLLSTFSKLSADTVSSTAKKPVKIKATSRIYVGAFNKKGFFKQNFAQSFARMFRSKLQSAGKFASTLQKNTNRWKIRKFRKNIRGSKKSKQFLTSLEKERVKRYRYTGVYIPDLVRLGFVSLYSKYAQFLITFFAFTLAKLPRNRKETKYVRFLAKLVKVFAAQRPEIIGIRLRFQGRINRWRRTKHIIMQKGILPLHTYETRFSYGRAQSILKKGAFGRRLWIAYSSTFHGNYKRVFQKFLSV